MDGVASGRDLLAVAGACLAVAVTSSCASERAEESPRPRASDAAARGRLTARPREPTEPAHAPGLHRVGERATLYVPRGYRPDVPHALVLALHGAGGSARDALGPFLPLADSAGLILVAPKSESYTWDVVIGGYGPDVTAIDAVLRDVFSRFAVDRGRIAIAGFSDGASYALSLGLTNGDLFPAIIAFSPGFSVPARREGSPRIFVSHGRRDEVLPIGVTSRQIVPLLERRGYDVRYREFDGPHTVPPALAREAVAWLL